MRVELALNPEISFGILRINNLIVELSSADLTIK